LILDRSVALQVALSIVGASASISPDTAPARAGHWSQISCGATKMSRYAALVSRRLYFAWKARRAFDRAQIAVKAVYDPDHIPMGDLGSLRTLGVQLIPKPFRDEKADRIYRLIVSIAPIADAVEAITDFLNWDGSNANQLMPEQQRADVRLRLFQAPILLQNALSCHLATYVLDGKR
jgi:hypothetical protein